MIDGDLIRRVFHYGSYPLLYAASDRFPLVGHEVSADISEGGMGSARRYLRVPGEQIPVVFNAPSQEPGVIMNLRSVGGKQGIWQCDSFGLPKSTGWEPRRLLPERWD
jgi:hypothetical protein